jgi:hypothetical protein
MKSLSAMSVAFLLAMSAGVAQGLPIEVPDFATDPSGPAFTIEAIGPGEGLSSNIASAPSLTYGVTDPVTGTEDVLQMNWEPSNPSEPAQAGWSLVFGQDPDLTNQTISLSINPPGINNPQGVAAITHLEVIIRDKNGLSCGGWGFNTDQSGMAPPGWITLGNDPLAAGKAPVVVAGPALPAPPWASLANNWMQTVNINIGNGPVAGSATILGGPLGLLIGPNYLLAGNGGSIALAQSLEFYENGNLAGSQTVPANAPPGLNNYWDHITVTPEPTTLALLVFGGLGLLRRRRE